MTVLHRRPGVASVATLTGIGVTLIVAHLIAPDWSRASGLDIWNLHADEAALRAECEARAELVAVHERMYDQIRLTDDIVAELIAGRVSLPDVVDRITRVNAGRPGFPAAFRCAWPESVSVRDAVALYTLSKAHAALAEAPHRAAVERRLDAEYRALPK